MQLKSIIGVILCVFCAYSSVYTQSHGYDFSHLDVSQGLSHNQVTSILKDKKGFLWFGTTSGLNRYDGYEVKIFRNSSLDSSSLAYNNINRLFELPHRQMGIVFNSTGVLDIYQPQHETFVQDVSTVYQRYGVRGGVVADVVNDGLKTFWFVTPADGIVRYNEQQDKFERIGKGTPHQIASDEVSGLACAAEGTVWIIHSNGILEQLKSSPESIKVVYRNTFLYNRNNGASLQYRILADRDGDLWIYVLNDNQGIYFFDIDSKNYSHYHKDSKKVRLNTDIVSGIVEDDEGHLWIATDHGGINLVDKTHQTVQYLCNKPDDEKSLRQNSINTIYKDNEGVIWIGTFKKGVSYYHPNIIRFPLVTHNLLNAESLPYSDVNRFVEDDKGIIWIGTNGGGLIRYDRKENTFKQYKNDPGNPNSISSDVIVSLCIDRDNKLWIGTYYGGLNCFDGKNFKRFMHDPNDPSSLSDRNVWEIFEDSKGRLWIGTLNGGLDLFNKRTKTFTHFNSSNTNSVRSNYISAIAEDSSGNLWIGTSQGIDVLEHSTGRFTHYEHIKGDKHSVSDNNILDIKVDSIGNIWIATHAGLNLYDRVTNSFRVYGEDDGLPHASVLTVLEERPGSLWISTPNGISNLLFSKGDLKVRSYEEADGLQGKQFNENAALKTKAGELIFGGSNGLNIFKPEQIGVNDTPPQILLSDLQLFSRSVKPGEIIDGTRVLATSITEAEQIVLPPGKNVFSIKFAALNYFHPERNTYQYRLEGFNNNWLPVDPKSRSVTFTNLDPGEYVLNVKAANHDGVWNDEGTSVKITVLPPFWKTKTAMVLYFVALIAILLIIRKLIQQREKLKFAIAQERQEALRMHELDMMKIRFFTNVSHEFRTPLSLILAPVEKLMKQTKDGEQQKHFTLIQRNAKRLLNLVNQLLDFRKLEVQEIKFHPSEGDIVSFTRDVIDSFSDLAEKKSIHFQFDSAVGSLNTIFDQDKLEKILFNLLSNAFKFTPEGGTVTVTLEIEESQRRNFLTLKVQDTGIGIAEDKQEKIFERFFQNDLPVTMVNQGSGIGLSITREFVKSHGGTIAVKSTPGNGSCFTVRIPVQQMLDIAGERLSEVTASAGWTQSLAEPIVNNGKPVLLLVEDNEDFRFYLKDNLKQYYQVVEARNGRDGIEKAFTMLPDLIVSDIMMPEVDGIKLCKTIKSDQKTSHIPVVLLTARSSEEQKLEGFETGADDYVTKPFNFEILLSRMKNLIEQRRKFQNSFSARMDVKATELNITPLDEKFIQNAISCVEKNASSPEFTVEELSRELGMSRANLYKKILALTGKSPLEFIRTIRLQQAAQLLERSQLSVAEIAYQVGFNNPKYFTKYFKEAYKVLPSAYAAGKRLKNQGI